MSQRAATITSLPMAFEVVKSMQADGLDWGEGYRPLGRQALAEIIEDQMTAAIDRYLDQLEADEPADRRNGYYRRHLPTELGAIELSVSAHPALQSGRECQTGKSRSRPSLWRALPAWPIFRHRRSAIR